MARYVGTACDTCAEYGRTTIHAETVRVAIGGRMYEIDSCLSKDADVEAGILSLALESIQKYGREVTGGLYTSEHMHKVPQASIEPVKAPAPPDASLVAHVPPEGATEPPKGLPPIPPTPATTQVGLPDPAPEEKAGTVPLLGREELFSPEKKEETKSESPLNGYEATATLYGYFARYKEVGKLSGRGMNAIFGSSENDTAWYYDLQKGKRVTRERMEGWEKILGLPLDTIIRMYIRGRDYVTHPPNTREYSEADLKEGKLAGPEEVIEPDPPKEPEPPEETGKPRPPEYLNDSDEEKRIRLGDLRYKCRYRLVEDLGFMSPLCGIVKDNLNRVAHAWHDHGKEVFDIDWAILGLPQGWNLYTCETCGMKLATRSQYMKHPRACPKREIKIGNLTIRPPTIPKDLKPNAKRSPLQAKAILGRGGETRGNNPRTGK